MNILSHGFKSGMVIPMTGDPSKTLLLGHWKTKWRQILAKEQNYVVDIYMYTDTDYICYRYEFRADNDILTRLIEQFANEMVEEYYPEHTFNHHKSFAHIRASYEVHE